MTKQDLESALTAFQDAAVALQTAWEDLPGDAIADYPAYMPDFSEFVVDICGATVNHDRDMTQIVRLVQAEGVACTVEQTGGGCATIYAGEPVDSEDGPEFPVAAGPGEFYALGGPTADDREFYVGPTDYSNCKPVDYTNLEGKSEAEIAAEIVRYVREIGSV